ncbi:hypothetical protein MCA0179 [Methylococcus capsulatus str. Bath]|uniref:Uncharacterized protein n=1 Tax=Methylococcus capsulatus (strain ATCC 33009 / NCIMB 11132 / Bath) TaxID=243233 RepID=Q60CC9_METCA|nr:hypothetical protein MCA0179 [Methylococcus capsulatus str. Bath]
MGRGSFAAGVVDRLPPTVQVWVRGRRADAGGVGTIMAGPPFGSEGWPPPYTPSGWSSCSRMMLTAQIKVPESGAFPWHCLERQADGPGLGQKAAERSRCILPQRPLACQGGLMPCPFGGRDATSSTIGQDAPAPRRSGFPDGARPRSGSIGGCRLFRGPVLQPLGPRQPHLRQRGENHHRRGQTVADAADHGQPGEDGEELGQPPRQDVDDEEGEGRGDEDQLPFPREFGQAENPAHEHEDEGDAKQMDVRDAGQ